MRRNGPARPVQVGAVPYALFKRAAPFAIVASIICVFVGGIVSGKDGAVGALVGSIIVVCFYGLDLLALRLAEGLPGTALLPIMLLQYVIKVCVLAIVMSGLWDTDAFSSTAMATTVAVAVVVWTGALTVLAARVQTYSVDVTQKTKSVGESTDS